MIIKEQYSELQIEIVRFDDNDIITESTPFIPFEFEENEERL